MSGGGKGTGVGDEVPKGYGMVISAIMAGYDPDVKTLFDGEPFRRRRTHLMAWTVDVAGGCKIPSGPSDSATDGDLDVAYALGQTFAGRNPRCPARADLLRPSCPSGRTAFKSLARNEKE